MWSVRFEEEEAEGAVGECSIAVICIVPVAQGCEIVVGSSDECITAVVALRECQKVSGVEVHLVDPDPPDTLEDYGALAHI